MCGWSFISCMEGSLPWDVLKSRSQALISTRRAATSMKGEGARPWTSAGAWIESRDKSQRSTCLWAPACGRDGDEHVGETGKGRAGARAGTGVGGQSQPEFWWSLASARQCGPWSSSLSPLLSPP